MKPLIDFKLQPTLSADDNMRCYLMKDLHISDEVIGCEVDAFYKGDHFMLNIERTYIECGVMDSKGIVACVFLIEDEDEVMIEEANLLQSLLVLLKDDIQEYAEESKARDAWLKEDTIHVTI